MKQIRSGPNRRAVTQWTVQNAGGPRYFQIGSTERVLVVEDALPRQLAFRNWLGSSAKIVNRVDAAIMELRHRQFDWIFLDRDLGFGRFGEDVARHLVEIKFRGSVVAHTTNPFGADLIKKLLTDGGVKVECVPFGMFHAASFALLLFVPQ